MNGPVANDPEIDALLGAYALDALDPVETARVDAYLANNPAARAEVDELRETAASLALAPAADADADAPPELWTRISKAIEAEPKTSAPVDELAARRGRRSSRRAVWSGVLAVAAAVVVVVLAVQVVSLHRKADRSTTVAAAFDRAAGNKHAKQVALTASGSDVARVVLLPDGTGYMKNDALKPLAADQTYQLWALTGDATHPTPISAGVLGPDPHAVGFHVDGPVHGIAVSIERQGGAVQPTAVYASGNVA
jgi:anti-sigma-K factor RskA